MSRRLEVPNYGEVGAGGTNGRCVCGGGGASEVLPLQKGGTDKVLAMLKGGTTSFEIVLIRKLEVFAILMWAAKSFHPLKGGGHEKFYCLEGGCTNSFIPMNFTFVRPTHTFLLSTQFWELASL